MISAIGIRNFVENKVDLTKSRNVIITAAILGCALGFKFSAAQGISFAVGSTTISLSGLAIAAIVGILLNAILPGKDFVFNGNINNAATDTKDSTADKPSQPNAVKPATTNTNTKSKSKGKKK